MLSQPPQLQEKKNSFVVSFYVCPLFDLIVHRDVQRKHCHHGRSGSWVK